MGNAAAAAHDSPRPTMTIRIYTVDRHGRIISDRGTVDVRPAAVLPVRDVWAPCACPKCRVETGGELVDSIDRNHAAAPVDLNTMRETVGILLDSKGAPAGPAPSGAELETLTATLRGHLDVLMPEVERLTVALPENSTLRYCALACLGEARDRLRVEPSPRYGGPAGHARRLARVLNALCDHHEQLACTSRHKQPGGGPR
ncbi:DUF6415 family natural product biosynthesis protein [Streptomyces griseosporeus]|uniref:DUF6415 family natural product biosynthesis protein n=1 Tax=Streptomyces griseosporeus TaxID=1910 RepID=UPI00167E99FE|nr:DUF6415 family natural product biosynthesis protein [Streptomyces griseosporeus]